jgi:hypothetical protein
MGTENRSFDSPEEHRELDKTSIDILRFGDAEVGRFTFEPSWKWSECIKPAVGTDRCQNDHVGYLTSGRMIVEDADGAQTEISAGMAYRIPPGHDAWIVGDEAAVALEFKSAGDYAVAK